MSLDVLEVHAAHCGESRSLTTVLEEKLLEIQQNENHCSVRVVRRKFEETAVEQLMKFSKDDWMKPVKITFIGEEGVDAGGLTREFFTLVFEKTRVFDLDGFFTFDSKLLQEKRYCLVGKATSIAIIHGHPGPHSLNTVLGNYILTGVEPNISDVEDGDVHGGDTQTAIKEINNSENIAVVFENIAGLLDEAGFRRLLTMDNKDEAITALKMHNSFYKFMAPMLQFMEGLKLHGVLGLLQANLKEALTILCTGTSFPSSDDVLELYSVNYSTQQDKKEEEEMIIYDLSNFLQKVERGAVSTDWIDFSDDPAAEHTPDIPVTLSMGHVLQAFLGCPRIPRNIGKGTGIIEFDHVAQKLSQVNTCAPSLCFSSTKLLAEYGHLEKHLIYIITEAEGFGIA